MPGYSGTPLWKKLGLKPDMQACVINAPDDYETTLLNGGPPVIWGPCDRGQAFTHLFTKKRLEMGRVLRTTLATMDRDGMIWISWPKKASKVPTDITEDTIRAVALPLGLVDVKVCAVTEVWSGLKLVLRKELR